MHWLQLRSKPEFFSGHFPSSIMAAFASFIACYCWTPITMALVTIRFSSGSLPRILKDTDQESIGDLQRFFHSWI